MKKFIISVIIALLLLCCNVFASESCSLKVSITDFSYSTLTLPAGGNLGVNCTVKQIYDEDQDYTFIVLVTKNGEYFNHYETSGTLKDRVSQNVSGTVSIPSDTTGVLVETFVWDSIKNGKAIAPNGEFGGDLSSDNTLLKLYVDGKEMEIKDNMTIDYASLSHTPNISPIAKDSSAKIEIDTITSVPQDVNIKVTAQNGNVKNYVLSLKVADGKITDAYQLKSGNSKVDMTTDIAKKPVFPEGKGPTDVEDGYKTVVPTSKTLAFYDRDNFYLVDIPDSLIGKTVIQPSYQVLGYDSFHADKNNGNKEMGFFTIDRSADIYVYGVHDKTDWIVSQGYEKLGNEYKVSRTQNAINPASSFAYRKRFVVEEGKTKTVTLGGATSLDGTKDYYYIIVDFINPASCVGVKSINIEGIGNVELEDNVFEYDFVVMGEVNPTINCELIGVGAKAEYDISPFSKGQTATITLTSGDGTSKVIYKVNFVNFANALEEIKVDGTLIEGFKKDKTDYTFTLPFGVTEPKEVTASALSNPDIELMVTQATADNPIATVTLKNKLTSEEIVYTVAFEKSNKQTVTPTVSYLASKQNCFATNACKFTVSKWANQCTMNFLKIDVSSLKNKSYINDKTKFILNMSVKMQRYPDDTGMDSMTVKVLTLPDSFDWDTESENRSATGYDYGSTDYTNYVDGKTPVTSGAVEFTGAFETVSLDITSIIYNAISNEEDYAYLALAGDTNQKNDFTAATSITYYYMTGGDNCPTLTIEINE